MSDPVSNAVSTIRENLTESWTDWDVSHGDLIENNRTLAGLTPAQRNEVIRQLSDTDLDKWADEVNGTLGSLSQGERQDLFNALAEGLDGTQLARVTRAFEGHDGSVKELGNAIASRASADVKADYVREMAATLDGAKYDHGNYGPVQTTYDGSPEGHAVASVLASLGDNPAAARRAFEALSDPQLRHVFDSAAQGSMTSTASTGGATYSVDYNPELLARTLDAAAASGDNTVRARAFEQAAQVLGKINEGSVLGQPSRIDQAQDARVVSDAMTRLLRSDPNSIVTELRTNVDVSGGALATYNKQLLSTGQEAQVRQFILQLQQGNDGRGNAFQNFENRAVAYNLGYYTGSTAAAINEITSDRTKQADLIKNIFGTGYGAAGAINPATGVIASIGNGLTSQAISAIVDEIAKGDKQLKQGLYELAIPRGPDGRINQDGAGYGAFNSAFAAIAEANR